MSRRDHATVALRDDAPPAAQAGPQQASSARQTPVAARSPAYVHGPMGPTSAILIVEDDPDLAALLRLHLGELGFVCDHAADGESGLDAALREPYALVVLDLMLPRLDGLEVCKRLRQAGRTTPVLMLTSRGEEFDKVLGLELGADDYLSKPFSIRELLARVKALLRRVELDRVDGLADGPVSIGALTIEPEKRRVVLDGEPIELTAKEFDLLLTFARNPGRVFPRMELLEQVWGYTHEGYSHTVNSHINRLRAKIEPDPTHPLYVRTVWGVGYRFAEPAELGAS